MGLMSWLRGNDSEQPSDVQPKGTTRKLVAEVLASPNAIGSRKLDEDDLEEIQERYRKGESITALATAFNVDRKTIKKYVQDVVKVSDASDGAASPALSLSEWEQRKALELLEKRPDLADRFIESRLLGQSGRRPLDAETIREVHQYDDSEGWARITKDRLKQLEKAEEELEKARDKIADLTRKLDRIDRGDDRGIWSEARELIKELGELPIGKQLFAGAGGKVIEMAASNPVTGPYVGQTVEHVRQGLTAQGFGQNTTPEAHSDPDPEPVQAAVPPELAGLMAMPPERGATIIYQWALLGKSIGGWSATDLLQTILPLESVEELVQMLGVVPGAEGLTAAIQGNRDWAEGVLQSLKAIYAERSAGGQARPPAGGLATDSQQTTTSSPNGVAE